MSQTRLADRQDSAPHRGPLPSRLIGIGVALMVLMPVAMWLANRSSTLLLGLAVIPFVAVAVASGGMGDLALRMWRLLATPLGLAVAAFLGWALVSISWSHRPGASLRVWGELVLPIVFALAIAASGRFRPQPAWLRALALAIILACLLAIFELASGLSQRAALVSASCGASSSTARRSRRSCWRCR